MLIFYKIPSKLKLFFIFTSFFLEKNLRAHLFLYCSYSELFISFNISFKLTPRRFVDANNEKNQQYCTNFKAIYSYYFIRIYKVGTRNKMFAQKALALQKVEFNVAFKVSNTFYSNI